MEQSFSRRTPKQPSASPPRAILAVEGSEADAGDTTICRSTGLTGVWSRRLRGICIQCLGLARRTVLEASHDRITSQAASLAFHLFLAIFPATIALVGLLHIVGLSPAALTNVIHDVNVILPSQAATVIDQALRQPVSSGTGSIELVVGTLVAIWGGIEAMASLQVGLDVAFEVGHDRGFVGRRIMAVPLLAVSVLLGGIGFTLVVLGVPVGHLLEGSVPVAGRLFAVLWDGLRWLAALAVVMLLLSIYYNLGPARRPAGWLLLDPGSVLATVGWFATSASFSFYLDNFAHESKTYGSAAGVAVLLLWLFVSSTIVLLGAELNCELRRPDTSASAGPAESTLESDVPE